MPKKSPDGSEYTAKNGYRYRKVNGSWKAVHVIVAEEKLGRELVKGERVTFKDNDRTNLDPDNLVVNMTKQNGNGRIAWLEDKIAEYQAELDELRAGS